MTMYAYVRVRVCNVYTYIYTYICTYHAYICIQMHIRTQGRLAKSRVPLFTTARHAKRAYIAIWVFYFKVSGRHGSLLISNYRVMVAWCIHTNIHTYTHAYTMVYAYKFSYAYVYAYIYRDAWRRSRGFI
jgi:hypothetical protein